MEEAGAEGIVASDTSHSLQQSRDKLIHTLSLDDAVEKEYPKQGPTAAWKDNPVSGRTFTHMPPVVAAQAEVQILKTKPGGPDRLGKAASSRLQTPVSDRSSPEGLTPWTNEARETDKDVHNPNSSSSNGPHDTSTQPPLACAESDLTSSAASEEASRQVDLSSELSEEDDVHSKPESLPSDKVD
ncbi:uncharacterized protein LOC124278574 isoform X3 [Haliotis rubra]|uniref:uncharacterized protein LOC124278574 isoform X3 n=1 Tax=Haliotis rubra TaxID=36100 RepID=UPI001EE5A209|nr:uncharacterized protein LOC124278574 isoform X3 [Haliotis rubra]